MTTTTTPPVKISAALLNSLPRRKIMELLGKLAEEAGMYRSKNIREVVPPDTRTKLRLFVGHVTGKEVAAAFAISERHGRKLVQKEGLS